MTGIVEFMDRNLALEAVRVTEAAALSASLLMGRGDEKAADQAAVDAMRKALNSLAIDGTVVIGEGERDEAPMLFIGERVGTGDGPRIDIALDPLEGTTITARGGQNALSVIAMAGEGGFLNAPGVYMDKIAVGVDVPDGVVDLDEEPGENLKNLAKAMQVHISNLVVCILDRPRHAELIAKVREAGARITLISDGDVSGVIATSQPDTGVDVYVGIGGAPEGVLAAANVLREFMFQRVYLWEGRREEAEQAKQVVRYLFRHYLSRPEEIDSDFVIASDPPWRRVADYVAGMTDGFALSTAERLGHRA